MKFAPMMINSVINNILTVTLSLGVLGYFAPIFILLSYTVNLLVLLVSQKAFSIFLPEQQVQNVYDF